MGLQISPGSPSGKKGKVKPSAMFWSTICFVKLQESLCLKGRALFLRQGSRPRGVCVPHRSRAWRQSTGARSLPEVLIHCSHWRGCLVAKLRGEERIAQSRGAPSLVQINKQEGMPKLLQRLDSLRSLLNTCVLVHLWEQNLLIQL